MSLRETVGAGTRHQSPDSQASVFSTTNSAGLLGVMDSLGNLLNSVDSSPEKGVSTHNAKCNVED